jgi:uncharacterized glyoxalase superfamily protein PhnB
LHPSSAPDRTALKHRRHRVEAAATLALAGESECILSFEGDVDEIVRRAQTAAATIVTVPARHPWGYTGAFADPDGDLWMVTSPPAR